MAGLSRVRLLYPAFLLDMSVRTYRHFYKWALANKIATSRLFQFKVMAVQTRGEPVPICTADLAAGC
jgi:hypothetical protein